MNADQRAHGELSQMTIKERIVAVGRDVESRVDRYACVDVYLLAELLGISQPESPGPGWSFCRYVEAFTLEQYAYDNESFWTDEVHTWLKSTVSESRLKELEDRTASWELDTSQDLSFLTAHERQEILQALYCAQLQDSVGLVIARASTIEADGYVLNFESDIEDDGASGGLAGPYDERDGRFCDESKWGDADCW